MDVYEFVAKMAEQHKSLLKVVDLQNNSIQSLNNRLSAMAASQLVIFALLLESDGVERENIATHLRAMLDNPQIADNIHLVNQLKEFLEICEDSRAVKPSSPGGKTHPSWFKGIIQGGLSLIHTDKETPAQTKKSAKE